jgi:hypothetical protein
MSLARPRLAVPDLAGLVLFAWSLLLAYVSVPSLLAGQDLLADGGISVLGAVMAVLHLAAAVGITQRHRWARTLGIILAIIGVGGSLAVLIPMIGAIESVRAIDPNALPTFLAIPAGMVLTYGLALVVLLRSRLAFAP